MRRGTLERPGMAKPKVSILLDLELSNLAFGRHPEVGEVGRRECGKFWEVGGQEELRRWAKW